MNVEVQTNTSRAFQRLDLSHKTAVLRGVASSLALVCLCARVGARTVREFPLVGPVAIDVGANAAVSAEGLAILAPKTVSGLRVDETVGVHDWHDVEVKVVNNGLDVGIQCVLRKQLPREVLSSHCGDPLARMNGTVDEHCRF